MNAALRRTIRTGAALGSYLPPKIWRHGQRPLVAALRRQRAHRPGLPVEHGRELVDRFRDDIAVLEELPGRSFQDWLGDTGRGTYAVRSSWAPSARDASQYSR